MINVHDLRRELGEPEYIDDILSAVMNMPKKHIQPIHTVSDRHADQIRRIYENRHTGTKEDWHFARDVAYEKGVWRFDDNELKITDDVVPPVVTSTHVVRAALDRLRSGQDVLEIGTGSGAIALAIARKHSGRILATDICGEALEVAKFNAKQNGIKNVEFIQSDMWDAVDGRFDMIVSNPPCSTTESLDELEMTGGLSMPRISREGGADGMKFHRIIANNAQGYLKDGGRLVLQQCYNANGVEQALGDGGFDPELFENVCDRQGVSKVVVARTM